jgi:hypothetical protein
MKSRKFLVFSHRKYQILLQNLAPTKCVREKTHKKGTYSTLSIVSLHRFTDGSSAILHNLGVCAILPSNAVDNGSLVTVSCLGSGGKDRCGKGSKR